MSLSRGYRNYRGRTPKWKVVLAVVLVLVILTAGAVILMQRYIVYDETGTPHLRLPETAESGTPPEEDGGGEVDLTIQEPEGPKEIYAFSGPAGPLTGESWADARSATAASAPAFNAACVTLKDSAGHVYFDALSAVSGTVKTEEDTAAVLTGIVGRDSNLYTIARLSCFHDPR